MSLSRCKPRQTTTAKDIAAHHEAGLAKWNAKLLSKLYSAQGIYLLAWSYLLPAMSLNWRRSVAGSMTRTCSCSSWAEDTAQLSPN